MYARLVNWKRTLERQKVDETRGSPKRGHTGEDAPRVLPDEKQREPWSYSIMQLARWLSQYFCDEKAWLRDEMADE
jgi:hypothetical protein